MYGFLDYSTRLLEKGFGSDKVQDKPSLDSDKIKRAVQAMYGEAIFQQYFPRLSSAIVARICSWSLSSPERYALLAVLAGIPAKELFGPPLSYQDPLHTKLLEYRKTGIVYRKEELAQKIGVSPSQLDSLARKYDVTPFWKQCSKESKRQDCIRIMLTHEEKELLYKAAKASGDGQIAVFPRTMLLEQAKVLLDNRGGDTTDG